MRCAPPHTNRPKRNRAVANNGSDLVTIHPEPCRPLPICLVRLGGFGEVIPAPSRMCHVTCDVCGIMSARWLCHVADSFRDKHC